MPIEPPPCRWAFPSPSEASSLGVVGAGADLEPGTILAAYRAGNFPWPDGQGRLLWWSPDPRAVLPLGGFHESQSLRRLRQRGRFAVTRDRACAAVIGACATTHGATWITPAMHAAYVTLHALGWAHSVEVWDGETLVGGLYGVAVGGFFAAESMFHTARDTSKIALAELVEHLRARGFALLDVQMLTPHLASLGAQEVPRAAYLACLADALARAVTW